MKKLIVNSEECVGCHLCELACSFKHYGVFSEELSSIRIKSEESLAINNTLVCRQCEDAPCIQVCPTGAITKDENTGAVKIDSQKCIMCKSCISVCPYDAIFEIKVPQTSKVELLTCDLCGGDPECVKVCYTRAIEYKDVEEEVRGE
jgi:Fe-S-cluster-containing hydrogenase component 2